MSSLPRFRALAVDGEHLAPQIDITPGQPPQFTPAESGIQRQQHQRREIVTIDTDGRQPVITALFPPLVP